MDGTDEVILGVADDTGEVNGNSRRAAGWLLVGIVVGASGAQLWHHQHRDGRRTDDRAVDVRVSLAAHAGELNSSSQGEAVVNVPVVINNAGSRSVTLLNIKVTGPGAGYVPDLPGGPPAGLPRELPPGRSVEVRFGISADCSAPMLAEPHVTLVLRTGQSVRQESVAIPDLIGVWGQVRSPQACQRP